MPEIYDIAIIGGGINGCGIARDAAGRGLDVYLCEKGDLGGATSCASTKLLHGGLRYLEHYEFKLVREALQERERLWAIAPHFVRPLRFVLPYMPGMRAKWQLRLGLFIYDHIGGRVRLPGTTSVRLAGQALGKGLVSSLKSGFEYSDCWVEDNRLVVMNAKAASELGAVVETQTAMTAAKRDGDGWSVTVSRGGHQRTIRARTLINAAGPWANDIVSRTAGRPARGKVRLVQGSHIVVPKLYAHDRCFIFQNSDGRIFFTIPYEGEYTLVGTTDRDFDGDIDQFSATEQEKAYLCNAVSRCFDKPLTTADIVWSYSGVRPLYDDGASAAQKATRDYVIEVDEEAGIGLISIFGGKITTYRRLAEAVMDRLEPLLAREKAKLVAARAGWTGRTALPGGDFAIDAFEEQLAALRARYAFLPEDLLRRLFTYYGSRLPLVLGHAKSLSDLGRTFGAGLTEAEVDYLMREEWAQSAEDIVFRRSKLGLKMRSEDIAALDRFLEGKRQSLAG
ncbi:MULTISPECIES: glycerol-3-phosphate dehydrogenase [Shinella]|uniref:Glycerol-3-phosphate dehydrogenase n=1 Tax=Shinella sedimenti TaxID=2919913 RepID=A0ABT0CMW4_9HYPH|nr:MULTISPECIES: glycerol-3-phosphate dehydrogenase [Shinella]MCJ8149951.1 glycerol-3-phosphate dehydrogenase [Shinella sedimenti]